MGYRPPRYRKRAGREGEREMKFKLYATLRQAVGGKEVEVDVEPGARIGDALEKLFEKHPSLRAVVLDEEGKLRHHYHLFVNGRDIRYQAGMDTPVQPDDVIALFPPVAGG